MLRKDLAVTLHVTLPPPILTSSSLLLPLGGKWTNEKQNVCLHCGVRASGNQLRGGTSFGPHTTRALRRPRRSPGRTWLPLLPVVHSASNSFPCPWPLGKCRDKQ